MKRSVYLLFVLLISSCQSNAPVVPVDEREPTSVVPTDEKETYQFVPVDENGAPGSVVVKDLSIEVSGMEEVVFDWTNDRCEDENIPDIAARAFRDAEGR